MLTKIVVLFAVCISFVYSDYVFKKLCKDVDTKACDIHQVDIDKCETTKYCRMKKNKIYPIDVQFTPHFIAVNTKATTYFEQRNSDVFDEMETVTLTNSSMVADVKQTVTYKFTPPKILRQGKYPIKIKIYNAEKDTEACCVTFNIKIK